MGGGLKYKMTCLKLTITVCNCNECWTAGVNMTHVGAT